MGIPYLPGWADEISGNLNKLAGHLPAIFQPNHVASNRFEEMVKNDPTIIMKISNMDPATRTSFAQSLGYKGDPPPEIMNISEGNDIIDRRNLNEAIQRDPEGYWASKAGIRTKTQQQVDALAPIAAQTNINKDLSAIGSNDASTKLTEASTEVKNQEKELNTYLLKEKSDQDKVKARMKLLYPDLENTNIPELVHNDIYGKADPKLILAVNSDPLMKGIYDSAKSTAMTRMELQARIAIATARQPEDKAVPLQRYRDMIGAQEAHLNNTTNMMKSMKMGEIAMNKDVYDSLKEDFITQSKHVVELQNNYEVLYNKTFPENAIGKKGPPQPEPRIVTTSTGDPNGEMVSHNFLSKPASSGPATSNPLAGKSTQQAPPPVQQATTENVTDAIKLLKTNPGGMQAVLSDPRFSVSQKATIKQAFGLK